MLLILANCKFCTLNYTFSVIYTYRVVAQCDRDVNTSEISGCLQSASFYRLVCIVSFNEPHTLAKQQLVSVGFSFQAERALKFYIKFMIYICLNKWIIKVKLINMCAQMIDNFLCVLSEYIFPYIFY